MYHRWAALALVLALCAISPKKAAGQRLAARAARPEGASAGTLGQNYPNPFNPDTYIPFSRSTDCDGGGGSTSYRCSI